MSSANSDLLDSFPKLDKEPDNGFRKASTSFARKILIHEAGGKLYGNWSTSFSEACVNPVTWAYLEKDSVSSIRAYFPHFEIKLSAIYSRVVL